MVSVEVHVGAFAGSDSIAGLDRAVLALVAAIEEVTALEWTACECDALRWVDKPAPGLNGE